MAVTRTIARGFAECGNQESCHKRFPSKQGQQIENTLNYINLSLLTGKMGKTRAVVVMQ